MTYGHRRSNPFVLRTRDPFDFDRPRAVLDLLEFSIRLWPDSKIYYWHIWYAPAAKCVVKWDLEGSATLPAPGKPGGIPTRGEGAELVEFRPGR